MLAEWGKEEISHKSRFHICSDSDAYQSIKKKINQKIPKQKRQRNLPHYMTPDAVLIDSIFFKLIALKCQSNFCNIARRFKQGALCLATDFFFFLM